VKILLTGRNGQVGWELNRSLAPLGQVFACDRAMADLTKPEALGQVVDQIKPDVIVNAGAYTAVDKAESDEALALLVNGDAVRALSQAARACGALFVHYSTDYVFDGAKHGAYVEDDATGPLNAYGRSKLAGELAVQASEGDWLVFRTSWVYAARGGNFLRTMLRLAAERETLSVVADQRGTPTPARMVADITAHAIRQSLIERNAGRFESGIFHLTAAGSTNWHGFASSIFDAARVRVPERVKVRELKAISTSEYPTPARRPLNGVLDNTKLERRFGVSRLSWEEGMRLVLEESM
jgi:dTDP-4-dehydrorhamnose reductase